ncbi:MAG: hypothetical protein GF328_06125, partial [Candidatus Latescibacteria bacterium]|nr:hypothetical protein [Candidatus Latescibacterota bacterium]
MRTLKFVMTAAMLLAAFAGCSSDRMPTAPGASLETDAVSAGQAILQDAALIGPSGGT